MNVVDLHPEELLDRHRQGRLNDEEHDRLQAHIDRCAACRMELALNADFEGELALDSVSGELFDQEVVRALVADVVKETASRELAADPEGEALEEEVAALVDSPRAVGSQRLRGRRHIVWLVAAIVLIGGAAIAAWVANQTADVDTPAASVLSQTEPLPTFTAERAHQLPPPTSDEVAPEEHATEDIDKAPVVASIAPPPEQPTPGAAGLFAKANAARRAGDVDGALRLYAQLESQYPDSREAEVSHAIVGRLLMEKDKPTEAGDAFDKMGTKLGEQKLVGRAKACRSSGDATCERAAWSQLLAEYPDSLSASTARSRLEALK